MDQWQKANMPDNRLHIELQEGFAGDEVIIRKDGRKIYHNPRVTTRLQISLADSTSIPVGTPSVMVDVELPGKGKSKSISIDGPWPVYLGISLTPEGKIVCMLSQKPFFHL